MAVAHIEYQNFVARGLSTANQLIDLMGSGTYQASNTTVAQWKETNRTQFVTAGAHEDQKPLVEIASGLADTLQATSIYGNTEVAASNTTALWRAQFTAQDGSLAADYHGGRR